MIGEALLAAVAEAVLGYVLQESGLAERLRAGLGLDPRKHAFQVALARTYAAFVRQYPQWTASFFDERFLTEKAAPLLADLLTRRGRPDPAQLAHLYAQECLGIADPGQWGRLGEATCAAADFLRWLEAELAPQPALQDLWDSRALEQIVANTEAILRALEEERCRAIQEADRYRAVVEIAGDVRQGTVVLGNRNLVTQVFRTYLGGDYRPLADLYLPPDTVFGRVRLDNFVGRKWLEAELDRFLDEHDRGVWLLTGEAGVGKTTFLAHLVRERRYLHFFSEQARGPTGVTRALRSLAAQLVGRYRLEPYASRDALSAELAETPDFLERLIRQAAEHLVAGERLVIVVDGLGEAGIGLNGNVLGLPKGPLPLGVFLILSQRPVPVPLHTEPYPQRVDLRADDARNLRDAERYLDGVARQEAIAGQLDARGYDRETFVRVLREKSAGNWMYLYHVVREIREGRRAPLDLERLPEGLVGYYAEYWGGWREKKDWDRLYAPLLAGLAAAGEPVPLEYLQRWLGLQGDAYRLRRLLQEEWAAFIYKTEEGFRLYHASLRDFFRGEMTPERLTVADQRLVEEMAGRTREAHRRIADHYLDLAGGDWGRLAGADGGYGLRHLGAHLAGGERWEELHALVAEGKERQVWAEARHAAEGNYAGYLADLELARQWAEAEGKKNPAALGRQVRYALIESSIHSLAGNIPPALLVAAVEKGVLGLVAALAYARQVSDPGQRARALAGLAPRLPEDLLRQALEAAREIEDERARALALAGLAPHLPEDLLRQALEAAREIGDERARAEALAGLAPHLPPDLQEQTLRQALEAAREIEGKFARARALAGLAPHWAAWARQDRRAAYSPWPETLRALAARPRRDLLGDLRALGPALAALGGDEAVRETVRAIHDVGRWWP